MESSAMNSELKPGAALIVRAAADVYLVEGEGTQVQAVCRDPRLCRIDMEGENLRVTFKDDGMVRVPPGAAVRIQNVGGDALLSRLSGQVDVDRISGSLAAVGLARLSVHIVSGDVQLLRIHGPFSVHKIGGELEGESLNGPVTADAVGGDATLQSLSGEMRVRAGGDLAVAFDSLPAGEINLRAGGDLELYLPSGAGARLDMSGGDEIEIETALLEETIEEPAAQRVLGNGQTPVTARAGGDIRITDEVFTDLDLEEEMEDQEKEWERFARGREMRDLTRDIETLVRERTAEATRRAEDRVRAAMERLERSGRVVKLWGVPEPPARPNPAPPAPPAPDAPEAFTGLPTMPGERTTNEERLMVLRMLQEHKLTTDEAEQLLAALEGEID